MKRVILRKRFLEAQENERCDRYRNLLDVYSVQFHGDSIVVSFDSDGCFWIETYDAYDYEIVSVI